MTEFLSSILVLVIEMLCPRIKDLREDRDLKQRELAQMLRISRSAYSAYENGANAVPLEVLCALADFYGVSVDYLLGRTDEKKPYPKKK